MRSGTIRHRQINAVVLLMAVLPWLPWLVDDWLTSPTRLRMTPTERAIYLDLLVYQWKDGAVPADHKTLAQMAHVSDEEFAQAAPAVLRNFNLRRGRYQNKKLALRRSSAIKRKTNLAQRGHKGGQVKASRNNEIRELATTPALISVSMSSSGFTKPPNQEKTSSRAREASTGGNGYCPDAGWAWITEAYPQIRDLDAACRAWNSIVEDQATEDAIRAALAPGGLWRKSDQWHRGVYDDLANWLFRKLWRGKPAPHVSESEREAAKLRAL